MKILLQQKETGLYLESPGVWVENYFDALDFPSSTQAILFQRKHQIENVQMVFKFAKHGYSIRVPIDSGVSCAA